MIKREPAIKSTKETQDYFNTTLNQIDPKEIKKILSESKIGLRKKTECVSQRNGETLLDWKTTSNGNNLKKQKYEINHNVFHERSISGEKTDYRTMAKKAHESLGSTLEFAKFNHKKL